MKKNNINKFIIVLFILYPFMSPIFRMKFINNQLVLTESISGINEVIFLLVLSIILYIIFRSLYKNNIIKFSLCKKEIVYILIGVILLRIIVYTSYLILLCVETGKVQNDEIIKQYINDFSILQIIMFMSIYMPILEELVFRYIIIGSLFEFKKISIFVSILLFCMAHMPNNITSFIMYFLMGLVLSYSYYKTRSIFVSILIHCLNNLLVNILYILYSL